MKTIVRVGTNVSLYLFDDSTYISANKYKTTVGNPVEILISDCTTENSIIYENVVAPSNWAGWKYFYTPEIGWVLNPNWNPPPPDPVIPQQIMA